MNRNKSLLLKISKTVKQKNPFSYSIQSALQQYCQHCKEQKSIYGREQIECFAAHRKIQVKGIPLRNSIHFVYSSLMSLMAGTLILRILNVLLNQLSNSSVSVLGSSLRLLSPYEPWHRWQMVHPQRYQLQHILLVISNQNPWGLRKMTCYLFVQISNIWPLSGGFLQLNRKTLSL